MVKTGRVFFKISPQETDGRQAQALVLKAFVLDAEIIMHAHKELALKDKVAIITGASSGIGLSAAWEFAKAGAALVLVARREAALRALTQDLKSQGVACAWVCGDVSQEDVHQRAVTCAEAEFGGLDIAFNNAGTLGAAAPVEALTDKTWNEVLATNLTGAFYAARHQMPALDRRGGGALVFTSTFVGHEVGFAGMGAYAASKAGLIGLVRVLAVEGGPRRIRVNALLPGGTRTPMGQEAAPTPEAEAFVAGLHGLKRLAEPSEIAKAALFLASDAASFVTGTAFLADGGVSITRA